MIRTGYSCFLAVGFVFIWRLSFAAEESNVPPDSYGWIANNIILLEEPFFWFVRSTMYPELSRKTVTLDNEKYAYLYRKGERKGTVILLHGIMVRKEFYMPLVSHWVGMNKPLPTIIAFDLMGHGSFEYPDDYDFSIEHFTWHAARFVRHIQQKDPSGPIIILGHSLGGGIAALLKPLEDVSATATVLISPAGAGTPNTTDFKALVDRHNGLPFNYGSRNICQLIQSSVELSSIGLGVIWTGCSIYQYLACPYESWVKNKMFADLSVSEQQLLNTTSRYQLLKTHQGQPVFLVWTSSDNMMHKSRFTAMGEVLSKEQRGMPRELEGSHGWPLEHPDQAAKLVDSIVSEMMPRAASDISSPNPVYLFWLSAFIWHLSFSRL